MTKEQALRFLRNKIEKQRYQYHEKTYINFRKESKRQRLLKDALEAKLDALIASGYKYIGHTTLRAKMEPKSYSLSYNDRIIKLSVFDGKNYYWYSTDYHDDNKNKETGSPFATFKKKFKIRTDKTLLEAFGATKQYFKTCTPQPLYYQSPFWATRTWINNICKEDFSSHYPANAIGMLPDANTAKELDGTVLPNEEYKFAFYVRSGHMAVYNEFNTRDYIQQAEIFGAKVSKERMYATNYNLDPKYDKTILMKAANYNLEPEMNYYYAIKNNAEKDSKEYKEAKLFMLKFIGMMEQCSPIMYESYPFAHLAAVIKWRANIKTFKILKEIQYNNVIQVCVDGIIHAGKPVGTTEKALGNLITEISKAKLIQKGINQYIIKSKDKTERRTAGYDVNVESDNINDWQASTKVKFLTYIKNKYKIEKI